MEWTKEAPSEEELRKLPFNGGHWWRSPTPDGLDATPCRVFLSANNGRRMYMDYLTGINPRYVIDPPFEWWWSDSPIPTPSEPPTA